ncbi:MAG: hypothetical protein HQ483_13840 [Rhodospirillales bacterium]|nr:hypothetical protein [Rhodospirillales bacterium]
MNRKIIAAFAVSALLMAGACSTPVTTQTLPQMSFTHLGVLNFNVESIEIDNRYKASNNSSQIEARFPTPPATAIRTWAIDRFKPVGPAGSGTLRIVINQASVKETDLKLEKGFTATFTKQQSNQYDLIMDIALEIIDGSGKQVGFSAAKASRSITTGEDLSLNDRDKRWFEMTEKAMAELNAEMESNIRRYLASWLR